MENYTSDSSDNDNQNKIIDFSKLNQSEQVIEDNLEYILNSNKSSIQDIEIMVLSNNQLKIIPNSLSNFTCLKSLDISFTGVKSLPESLIQIPLSSLIAKNNQLRNETLPKLLPVTLKELNFSGNMFQYFPDQVLEMPILKYLYLGGNQINSIPKEVKKLTNLQILSMGGNKLAEIPASLGELRLLQALVLSDNEIESLPASLGNLHQLKSLLLHKNKLRTLPPDIIALKNLHELSLRDNPLVVQFVSDMTYNPATLMELAARVVKVAEIPYNPRTIPFTVCSYLNSAHCCVNPKCKGVYFDNRVEHIKFVDFCGKYRIPLLQYLCSSKCAATGSIDKSMAGPSQLPNRQMLRKVLLG